jgi:hypothetical protein
MPIALKQVDEVEPGMHEIAVMNGSGDTKYQWNPANPDEVAAAKSTFDVLRAKHYDAYRVTHDGKPGEQMKTWDPGAGSIIMNTQHQGG